MTAGLNLNLTGHLYSYGMQIPKEFLQFDKEPSFILITGRLEAVLYHAQDGNLRKIDEYVTEKPQFTDQPGVFITRTSGEGTIRSGSIKDIKKESIVHPFFVSLERMLRDARRKYENTCMYIFTPAESKKTVQELAKKLNIPFEIVKEGNYVRNNIMKLISDITQIPEDKKVIPTDKEAQDILSKPTWTYRVGSTSKH